MTLSRRALLGGAALALPIAAGFAPRRTLAARVNPVDPPRVTAAALYVEDISAGVPLMELNADERRPPASTTKIATALVVMQHAELDETIVFDSADIASEDESRMSLVPGDTLTVEQLLQGLLLPSGNDAARALARHVGAKLLNGEGGDPIERFIQEMNALVAEMGLENTQFASVEGLERDGQYSSARDLAALAERVLRNRTLADIAAQYRIDVTSVGPEARTYELQSSNQLIEGAENGLEGIIGLKTGTTPEAGANLIIARRVESGNRVVAVVLGSDIEFTDEGFQAEGSDRRYDDMRAVLETVSESFRWLAPTDDAAVPGLVGELAAWQVELRNASALVLPVSHDPPVGYQMELMPPGGEEGAAGRVLFFAEMEQIAERTLAYRQ